MWYSSSNKPEGYHGHPMSKACCLFLSCYAASTSYRPQFLIQDDSSTCFKCFCFVVSAGALWTRARPYWRRFLRWLLCPSRASSQLVHIDRCCHIWVIRSATELPNSFCEQLLSHHGRCRSNGSPDCSDSVFCEDGNRTNAWQNPRAPKSKVSSTARRGTGIFWPHFSSLFAPVRLP